MFGVGDYVKCKRGIMCGRIGVVSEFNPRNGKFVVGFIDEHGHTSEYRRYSYASLSRCINPALVNYSVGDEVICVDKHSMYYLKKGVVIDVLYEYNRKRRIIVKFSNCQFGCGMELSDITSANIPALNIVELI